MVDLIKKRDKHFSFDGGRNDYYETSEIHVLGESFDVVKEDPLPPVFDAITTFKQVDKQPLETIFEKLNNRYQKYNLVMVLSDDAEQHLINNYKQENIQEKDTKSNTSEKTDPFSILSSRKSTQQEVSFDIFDTDKSRLNFKMTLAETRTSLRNILNLIASNTGLYWRYIEGHVEFYRNMEETYVIDAATQNYTSSTSQQNASNGDSGSTNYQVEVSQETRNALESMFAQVKAQLSSGGHAVLDTFSSTITVVDTPIKHRQIKEYIDQYNAKALTTFALKVDVYEIITDVTDNKMWSFAAMFKNANLLASIKSPASVIENAGQVEARVTDGKFSGSKVVMDMLNRTGNIFSQINQTGNTRNNVPVLISSAFDRTIAQGQKTTTNDGVSETETIFKTLQEGFSINAKPSVSSDGRINMEVTLNVRTLQNLKTVVTETEQYQLDDMKSESTVAAAVMRDGETFMLNGYERTLTSSEVERMVDGVPWWVLGGANKGRTYKTALLVFVTPYKKA